MKIGAGGQYWQGELAGLRACLLVFFALLHMRYARGTGCPVQEPLPQQIATATLPRLQADTCLTRVRQMCFMGKL